MRYLISALLLPSMVFASDAHDHGAHASHDQDHQVSAPAAQAAIAWKPVDVRFETTTCEIPCKAPKSRTWTLRRDERAIELRGSGAPYGEVWRRLDDGKVDYAFVMHDEDRMIEYAPIDLQLINKVPDWERLGAVVAAEDIERLKAGKRARHEGFATRSYTGSVNGAKVEVVWIPELHLPAKIDSKTAKRRVTVRLLAVENSPAPPMPDVVRERYQRVDYADLGDMEEDPDAQRWIRKAINAPGHEAHNH